MSRAEQKRWHDLVGAALRKWADEENEKIRRELAAEQDEAADKRDEVPTKE
jgi:hypothetical protein